MANEIEEYYRRIVSLPRVVGFMVITLDGISIKSTLGNTETLKYAGQVAPLIDKTRKMIRELVVDEEENTTDDVAFIRLRTTTHEVLIAPHNDYAMIVLQLPHEKIEQEEQEAGEGEGGEGGKGKEKAGAEKEDKDD